jgi:hypothetical protein
MALKKEEKGKRGREREGERGGVGRLVFVFV